MNGTITKEQIVSWMKEPTDAEKAEKARRDEIHRFFDNYERLVIMASKIEGLAEPGDLPYTAAKCLKWLETDPMDRPYRGYRVDFIDSLVDKYDWAVIDGHIEPVEGMWNQIEAYLRFDADRKAAAKAAKAAARKAKKAAPKA